MALIESLLFGVFVIISIKLFLLLRKHLEMKQILRSIPKVNLFTVTGPLWKPFSVDKMFENQNNLPKAFGSPVKFCFGPASFAVVVDTPEDIKTIFNSVKFLDKPAYYEYLNLGKGLFVSNDKLWAKNRKILSRAFNVKMLENSIPVICEKSEKLVEKMRRNIDKGEFDVLEYVIDGIVDTMFKTILDTDASSSLRNRYMKFAER